LDTHTIRFVIIAAALYGLFHAAYLKVPDENLRKVVYPNIIGHAAAKVITIATPKYKVRVKDNTIRSGSTILNIVRGCDGSGVWFMLMSAVIGFGIAQQSRIGRNLNDDETAAMDAAVIQSSTGISSRFKAACLGIAARTKEMLVGLLLGSLVVYIINQIRIVGLFYLVDWKRSLFPVVHTYFAPTLIILIIAGFFLWWTQWSMKRWTSKSS